MERYTNDMLDLIGESGVVDQDEKDLKDIIKILYSEDENNKQAYFKIICSMNSEEKKLARERFSELLRYARTRLNKSDGQKINACMDAIFDAYFEGGPDEFVKAVQVLF